MRPALLPEDVVRSAKQAAESMKGMAELALNLIVFPEKVRKSMETIFGRWLVCSN
jgi:hypothetical protein